MKTQHTPGQTLEAIHDLLTGDQLSEIGFYDNYKLFSAAPELLQLLGDVGQWLEAGLSRGQISRGTANRDGDLVSQIRAAVTKAIGEDKP